MKRLLSFFLAFVTVIGLFPITAMASTENVHIEFSSFTELQDLVTNEYSDHAVFDYVGTEPLVIESDLIIPQNTQIWVLESRLVVSENVTMDVPSLTCAELVVEGSMETDTTLVVYDFLNVSGSIVCNDVWINIDDTTEVYGEENVLLNGDSKFAVKCYPNSVETLKEACARAAEDTRSNWIYGFTVREPLIISEHITVPENSTFFIEGRLTIDASGTLEIYGGAVLQSQLTAYGTLITNANSDITIHPEYGGKLEIAPSGTYIGNSDFFVWGWGEFDPNTAFSGIDLSHYSVTSDTEYGTSWYYTYTEATEPPETESTLPTITGTYTTDLVMPAADLGVSAPDSVLRATLTFTEDGKASATWEAVDLTAFRLFFHDMFVNAYYAMAYGAGITDINEIEAFCMESTGMSVSAYMDTIVTEAAMKQAFTPASTQGSYSYAPENKAIFTDLALMDLPSDPAVESPFTVENDILYLNAASWGKPDYTFVCTAK